MKLLTYDNRFENKYIFDRDIAKPDFSSKERVLGIIGLGVSQFAYATTILYDPIAPAKHKSSIAELKKDLPPQIDAFKLAVFHGELDREFVQSLQNVVEKNTCNSCPVRRF